MDPHAAEFFPIDGQTNEGKRKHRPKETGAHRLLRRERQQARMLLAIANARSKLVGHHSWDWTMCQDDRPTVQTAFAAGTRDGLSAQLVEQASALSSIGVQMKNFDQTLCRLSEGQVLIKDAMVQMAQVVVELQKQMGTRHDQGSRANSGVGNAVIQLGIASAHWEPLCSSHAASSSWLPLDSDPTPSKSPQVATPIHIEIPVGNMVKIRGLRNEPTLNGATGVVLSYHKDMERYAIQLDVGKNIRVKHENVLDIGPPGVPDSSDSGMDESDSDGDITMENNPFNVSAERLASLSAEDREEIEQLRDSFGRRRR
jgi:hypothetical protein